MTEMKEYKEAQILAPALERFVLHWGEMGTSWGVNRSVGQIHALLYVSTKPIPAEDIALALNLARSNVSNSLKELLNWKLIKRVHLKNDRRDHFEAETDLWEMLLCITNGRKEREIDPTIALMKQCSVEAKEDQTILSEQGKRLDDLLVFMAQMDGWYSDMATLPKDKLTLVMKMGKTIIKLLGKGKEK